MKKKVLKVILLVVLALLLLLSIFFVFAVKPNAQRAIPLFAEKRIAHRGLHSELLPENSLAAFQAAKQAGIPVELDVQLTADGQVVVFHDENLLRVCGADAELSSLTYAELQQYKLLQTEESIPLLSMVLELLDGVSVVCEIKNASLNCNTELCAKTAELLKQYKGEYSVQSFNPFVLQWYAKNAPEIIRGQLAAGFENYSEGPAIAGFLLSNLLLNFLSKPDYIAYEYTDDSFGYKLCRVLYKPVTVGWTAKGAEAVNEAAKSYDIIIFEQ